MESEAPQITGFCRNLSCYCSGYFFQIRKGLGSWVFKILLQRFGKTLCSYLVIKLATGTSTTLLIQVTSHFVATSAPLPGASFID